MADVEIIVPVFGMIMIIAIVALVVYYAVQRQRLRAGAGGDYQRLAEESVRGQRILLEETKRMNETLKEIERLLREV